MSDQVRLSRRRRYAVRALVLTATIVAVAAIFAVFANRQVLDAENWSDTSTAMLEDPQVRGAISNYLVDEVYANVDVQAQIAGALPPRLQPLSGPAANSLQTFAEERTNKLLGRPRVQEAWRAANRRTAQQFIDIAEGDSKAISTSGNAVVLDLRIMLLDLVQRLGLPGTLAGRVPEDAAQIRVMSGDQVTTLQGAVSALRGLGLVLPLLALGLLALAVWLARGRRRETLMQAGFSLVVAGGIVLIGRNVAGDSIVDSLAETDAVKPAAASAWTIGTQLLEDAAEATILVGLPLILAALLAGPMGLAVGFRRTAAPWLRDRPGVTYGVAAALVLLVLAWGPIAATREVIPVLLMTGVVIAGVEALRRQVALEFPETTAEHVGASLRAGIANVRGHNGSSRPASQEGDEEFAGQPVAPGGGRPTP